MRISQPSGSRTNRERAKSCARTVGDRCVEWHAQDRDIEELEVIHVIKTARVRQVGEGLRSREREVDLVAVFCRPLLVLVFDIEWELLL